MSRRRYPRHSLRDQRSEPAAVACAEPVGPVVHPCQGPPGKARKLPKPWQVLAGMLLVTCLGFAQLPAGLSDHVISEGPLTVRVQNVDAAEWEHLESMLKDQLTLSGASSGNEPLADDLAFFTRQHLIREGHPDAEVRWELQSGSIVLAVQMGPQIRVGNILWTGDNHVLPPEEMRKFLLRPSIEKEGADKTNPAWVDSELQTGVVLMQRRLRAEGYLQSTVTLTPAVKADTEGLRDLTVEVQVGPQFQFGTISFNGAPPELTKRTHEIIAKVNGGPFNEARVQQIELQLSSLAQDSGWLDASATSSYEMGTKGGTVDVAFYLTTGSRYRVGQALPHPGFSKGSQRVLRAGFRELQGLYYSAEDMDVAFRRALDTSMFARLDVDPKKIGRASILPQDASVLPATLEAPVADLVITGEETKPKTLGFEVGFDTFLGPQAGVTWRNTNLWDTGNTLAADLSWSNAGPLGSVSIKNPAFLNSSFAASARLAVETFDLFEYTRYGTSLSLELSRRVSRHFSYGLFGGASLNTVSTDKLTDEEIGPDQYTLAFAGLNFLLDYRDSKVLPKKGWFVSGRVESTLDAMGSGVSYLRTDLRTAWYRPITKKLRFAAGGALLSIQGAPAEDIPIDSRVFNGGPNSVRAFAERELGPLTKGGTPLGGTSALITNAELSYEIYRNLEFAVFTDVGSLGRGRNSSPFDYSSDFRIAAGAGLRYHLPFGPIRIDYGHNVSRREGEGSGMLHVTVGFAF